MKKDEDNRKKWAQLIAKAWFDEKFKKHLLTNPQQVLNEWGIDTNKGITYKVMADTETTHHLIIPEKPPGSLSETELMKIAAAATGNSSSQHSACV